MGMMLPTLQQILAGFDNPRWLLTPGEICSGSKVSGALVQALFIASWWPCPERHSATVVHVVLRWSHGLGAWHSDPLCVTSTLELFAGPPGFIDCMWHTHDSDSLSANEVGRWLKSVVILVQFTASFLSFPQVPYWRKQHVQVWGLLC